MNFQGIFGPFWQKVQKIIDFGYEFTRFLEAFSGRQKCELVPGDIKISRLSEWTPVCSGIDLVFDM